MIKAISLCSTSAEFMSSTDWENIFNSPNLRERVPNLIAARDPLANISFQGVRPFAIYGFAKINDRWVFSYFWALDSQFERSSDVSDDTLSLEKMVSFGLLLKGYVEDEHTFGRLRAIVKGRRGDLVQAIQDQGRHLYWCNFGSMKFAGVYSSVGDHGKFSAMGIGRCISFHFDYFRLKSPVWDRVPLSFLADAIGERPDLLTKVLTDPKNFDPTSADESGVRFLWPWQRSIEFTSDAGSNSHLISLAHKTIKTTSFVFDIRKSTMVLEQLKIDEKSKFPSFIDNIVQIAKKCIFKYGGFFDKETGDGIVAHFCDFELMSANVQSASVRAFCAAKELLCKIQVPCSKIQDHLNLGVGSLGGSVGLHTSEAVWLCQDGQISALGDSVIMAARLCGEADNYTIFISNSEYHQLLPLLDADEAQRFSICEYAGKEYSGKAGLYGRSYSVCRA